MPGSYLLDTNAVIAKRARDQFLEALFTRDDRLLVSVVTAGELIFGALRSGRVSENLSAIATYTQSENVLTCDLTTARHYGEVKRQLRSIGRPIPDNDVWIAATAIQHNLVLVTRDAHFDQIEGLSCLSW